MFGRQKTPAAPAETPDSADDPRSATGKGRPTPKRKVAEAANKRPLVPNDRASARKAQREKFAQQRKEQQQALVSGQEDKMPVQHRGPVRRYMRDYVDARFSPGELFLPAAVLVILILWGFGLLTAGQLPGVIAGAVVAWGAALLGGTLVPYSEAQPLSAGLTGFTVMLLFLGVFGGLEWWLDGKNLAGVPIAALLALGVFVLGYTLLARKVADDDTSRI